MSEQKTGKSMVWRVVILSALLLVGSVVGMRLLFAMKQKPVRKQVAARMVSVQTQVVQPGNRMLWLEGFGTAEASKSVDLVPEISGQAVYVSEQLKEGARVRKGTLLLRVDTRDYALEYNRLKQQLTALRKQITLAQQALALNHRHLQRNRRLYQRKVIDSGSYEQQRIRHIERQQQLESLKQSAAVTQVQLATAALRLRKARVRAPFDARVVKANLDRGDYVSQGKSVATLESRDAVEIPVAFPIDTLRRLTDKDGRPVDIENLPQYLRSLPEVQVLASGTTSPVWRGRVVRVGGKLDLSTRTLPLWIRVSFPGSSKRGSKRGKQAAQEQVSATLLPGTFCKVQIPTRRTSGLVAIPRQALYDTYVYLAVDGKLQRRQVEVAHTMGDTVYIAKGLQAGDRLIVSPLTDPIEGTRISQTLARALSSKF